MFNVHKSSIYPRTPTKVLGFRSVVVSAGGFGAGTGNGLQNTIAMISNNAVPNSKIFMLT